MKKIGFVGPVATRSGYGAHARDILSSLIRSNKYDIKVISLPWGATPMDALDNDDELSVAIRSRIVPHFTEQPDIFIQVSIPNEFQPVGKFNIGITAGIETTACAPQWIEGCNRMNLIITTSHHSKDVFEMTSYDQMDKNTNQKVGELRLTTPIEVLLEGSDLETYFKTDDINIDIDRELKDVKESFAFLFVGHWIQGGLGADRKDIGMLIHTFCNAFKDKASSNKPALILKTSGATFSIIDREECTRKIQEVRAMIGPKAPNVYLLHGDLTDNEMNSLYNHPKIKAMVSFTHGEGYGRPLQEFALIGKPVITSDWSGHLDFIKKEYHTLLPGEVKQVDQSAVNDWILSNASWFVVNHIYAAQVLKHVYDNYKDYVEKSRKGIKYLKDNFSIEAMDKALDDIMSKYESKMPQQVKLQLPTLIKTSQPKQIQLPKLQKI
jgi:glycosyltransferase involved in cell wall biosynthesis